MKKLQIYAPAKINLSLDIVGLRSDGYHELEMIMQEISLYDIITIEKTNKGIILESNNKNLPTGESNLAYQAVETIFKASDLQNKGIKINIKKNIPIAAGLGGGSSDAAAVLKGINYLYNLDFTQKKLRELGSVIGTDVPFFITGGTVYASGIGQKIYQLPDISPQIILLINPDFKIKTEKIYNEYDKIKPDIDVPTTDLVRIIKSEKDINWNEGWNNILEPITMEKTEAIKQIKDLLKSKYKIKFCLMSGSGPTVFAILDNFKKGQKIIDDWPRNSDNLYLITTLPKKYLF
ncbi:MAG: 4-(cytidine 5'-diphospho)-2-C-methyl-D-erythritol kinase [Halanaerobiaceae bacterium]